MWSSWKYPNGNKQFKWLYTKPLYIEIYWSVVNELVFQIFPEIANAQVAYKIETTSTFCLRN